MGIWCGTKAGASFFLFVLAIYFPCGQFFFSAESQFHCHRNVHFHGQFPCIIIYALTGTLKIATHLLSHDNLPHTDPSPHQVWYKRLSGSKEKFGQILDTQTGGHCDSSAPSSSPIQLCYRDEVGRKHWDSGYI